MSLDRPFVEAQLQFYLCSSYTLHTFSIKREINRFRIYKKNLKFYSWCQTVIIKINNGNKCRRLKEKSITDEQREIDQAEKYRISPYSGD